MNPTTAEPTAITANPPQRSGTLLDKLCRQFVHAAGKVASAGIIAHKDAWRADGGYRNVDPGVIHVR